MPRKADAERGHQRKKTRSTAEIKSYAATLQQSAREVNEILSGMDEVAIDGTGMILRAIKEMDKFIPKLIAAVEAEKRKKDRGGGGATMAWSC